jgi:triosephosphate isomerase
MAKPRPLIAGNWKMNGLTADGTQLARTIAAGAPDSGARTAPELLVCPPAPLIALVRREITGSGVALGGQDCHAKPSGAFTGDTAAPMLADLGCTYVIVGHSERRQLHGEGDRDVKLKAYAAREAGLIAIVCIGETLAERDAGRTLAVIEAQLAGSLPEGASARDLVVAYEPVWAIGTGRTASVEQVAEVHALIRRALAVAIPDAAQVRILYGGSVKPDNAVALLAVPDVDGALVGGASLDAKAFLAIAAAAPAWAG